MLETAGGPSQPLVRPGGLGSPETPLGCACLYKGQLRMKRSKGHTGATGSLRALTGWMHSVSACAHPCSAPLSAGPGDPLLGGGFGSPRQIRLGQ